MAILKNHGEIVGKLTYTTHARLYMSDGSVLRNDGMGWKLSAHVKPGIDVRDVYRRAENHQIAQLADRPALVDYRKALHRLTGLSKAWKLHACIKMMPSDPDGVWSECCDNYGDNVHANVGEIVELCRMYECMCRESNDLAEQSDETREPTLIA